MKTNREHLHLKLFTALTLILLLTAPFAGKTTEKGQQLYGANCAKCHGREGEGFQELYPPLEKSHFFTSDIKLLPCIIRYGMEGELEIDGKHFNGIMPGNKRISTEEMTILISHLQNRWGDGIIDVDIPLWLEQCPQ